MTLNRLAEETSPYLLQHQDNPVDWWAWRPEAFAAAKAHNKPVLLSVGYAACHWCHVMAHESFENQDVAALMNRLFVNIKVDREERPDIDHIYQTALAVMGGQGGWPLTMFLTPDGEPFWGGTYFPHPARYGRPGFMTVLEQIADAFQRGDPAVAQNRDAITQAVRRATEDAAPGQLAPALLQPMADKLLELVDWRHGGIGGAPKFPQTGALAMLWRAWWRHGVTRYRDAVTLALRQMAQGGIYDHLGGGFARYAVDERWLVPHFEKMLYDNALLVELLSQVWAETRHPLLAERVDETIGWVEREMRVEGGGLAASLDADSEGEEGKFYVWDAAEVLSLLGAEDARFFSEVYDVRPGGNWEGSTILNRLGAPEPLDAEAEQRLARCRETLLAARAPRIRPGRDDKTLADWSALMIAALTRAAMMFDRPDWLALARQAYDFVVQRMDAGNHRLYHSYRAGKPGAHGLLEDYAGMGLAACRLAMATGDDAYLNQAARWADVIETHFADPRGGYAHSANDGEALIARPRPIHDQATPSGNGLTAALLVSLYQLTGAPLWAERAQALFNAFGGEVTRNFFGLSSFLMAYEDFVHPTQIILAGDVDPAMLQAAWRHAPPGASIQCLAAGAQLAAAHPGHAIDASSPAAYVCADMTCSLPLTDADALAAHLDGLRGPNPDHPEAGNGAA